MEITPRMQFQFPIVAQVRKGAAKRPGKNKRGEDTMVVGPDLKDGMRVVFFPGAEEYRKLFVQAHDELRGKNQEHLIVHKLRAMIPFEKVWDSLEIWNEAYQANRMVYRANDKQVITRRDPKTGEYLVRDGDPFEEYVPGQPVRYERDGRTYELSVRTTSRLKLFLPDLGRMVMFELKSTSYYDSLNLRQNLGAIQMIANMLNSGVAGGIPFFVFRKEQQVTWNKPDGSALRVGHWIYQIEVDPAWVEAATRRMANFALTGQQVAGLLMPSAPLAGSEDPSTGHDDPEEDLDPEYQPPTDALNAEYRPEEQAHPAEEVPTVTRKTPAEEIVDAAPHDAAGKVVRPMTPQVLRAAMEVRAQRMGSYSASQKQVGLAATLIESVFSDQARPGDIRHAVTRYLIGCESLKDATGAQIKNLLDWLNPSQDKQTGEYLVDSMAAKELLSVWPESQRDAGQMELELSPGQP